MNELKVSFLLLPLPGPLSMLLVTVVYVHVLLFIPFQFAPFRRIALRCCVAFQFALFRCVLFAFLFCFDLMKFLFTAKTLLSLSLFLSFSLLLSLSLSVCG